MRNYLARRLLQAIPVLLGISLLLFLIMHALPGGPMAMYLNNPNITPEQIARMKHAYGLDRPLYVQYVSWLSDLVQGNLGKSFADGRPVLDRILERFLATLELMGASYFVAMVLAIPLGVLASLRQYSLADILTTVLAYLGISMPTFWFGIVLIMVFSSWLHWFPSGGRITQGGGGPLDVLNHLVLPTTVLALYSVATWSRYVRSSMLEVLRSDYVRTARAKGLSERIVIYKHALRNALVPVVTVLALDAGYLFSGALITETIFAWPGMGRLFWDSVLKRDYPLLMGILMIASILVVALNLLADLIYVLLDPRIQYN
ncbi:MAG: ABC transporter permease [Firmicutes bacterium]|nr:ABC transporter permease [Bacillota bacterium]MCL5040717.1 ABC transporter permease [Bacillota bacterium]